MTVEILNMIVQAVKAGHRTSEEIASVVSLSRVETDRYLAAMADSGRLLARVNTSVEPMLITWQVN